MSAPQDNHSRPDREGVHFEEEGVTVWFTPDELDAVRAWLDGNYADPDLVVRAKRRLQLAIQEAGR